LSWVLWTFVLAWSAIDGGRYASLGMKRLAVLTARDVVFERLPWLVAGVPIVVALFWLARRPRGLATLVTLVPFLAIFAARFEPINGALRPLVPERARRALVLLAIVIAAALFSQAIASIAGRSPRVRRFFERVSGALDSGAGALSRQPAVRLAFPAHLVGWTLSAVAFVTAAPVLFSRVSRENPSFVVILVDTLRADHMQPYGYSRRTTPHVLAWSERGNVFEEAVAQASWTKPSVASLFTSLMPSVHNTGSGVAGRREVAEGVLSTVPAPEGALLTGGTLPAGLVTVAEILREHGYRTAGFVANSLVSKRDGYGQGFEIYETLDDRRITESARRYLAEHRDAPFFLYLHYMAPHAPYDPPKEFDVFGAGSGLVDIFSSATKDSVNFTGKRVLAPEEVAGLVNQYDGEILFADSQIAHVLDAIDGMGGPARTIVALTSDHGEEFLDHGMVWHESIHLYEELTRIPLIVRMPHQTEGARIADPVMHIDLAPTFLALAGIEPPAAMQGRSLAPLLRGEPLQARPAYSETVDWGEKQAIWRGREKMIFDREEPRIELFRLDDDPGERQDLANAAPDLRAALLDSLNHARDRNGRHLSRLGVSAVELEPEQLERLRSLGYIQ